MTGATFDPTVLGAVIRAGYADSFDKLPSDTSAGVSELIIGCTDIVVDGNAVTLPAGTGFDPAVSARAWPPTSLPPT